MALNRARIGIYNLRVYLGNIITLREKSTKRRWSRSSINILLLIILFFTILGLGIFMTKPSYRKIPYNENYIRKSNSIC